MQGQETLQEDIFTPIIHFLVNHAPYLAEIKKKVFFAKAFTGAPLNMQTQGKRMSLSGSTPVWHPGLPPGLHSVEGFEQFLLRVSLNDGTH